MKTRTILLCVLAICILLGYAVCAAPLSVAMPINYFGTIALWSAFIFTLEEIYWDFLMDEDKNKNNNEPKN